MTCHLNLRNKGLTELPLDIDYKKFTAIDIRDNNLTNIDVLVNCEQLNILECDNNAITSLDKLPKCLKLLFCDNNAITSLDILPPELVGLTCRSNAITQLDNLPQTLIVFDCYLNPMKYFQLRTIRHCKRIKNINTSYNIIKSCAANICYRRARAACYWLGRNSNQRNEVNRDIIGEISKYM